METWKAVVGFEGLYEVSDIGRVRSLKYGKQRIMKPVKTHNGYLRVTLCRDGNHKKMKVHRLVAQAFIPNPNHLSTVNHKDEDKTNNAASNLEWLSMRDNDNYGTRNMRMAEAKSKPVQQFDKSTGELLKTFPSIMEAERDTGISNCNICSCCDGKRKSAGGFIWRKQ